MLLALRVFYSYTLTCLSKPFVIVKIPFSLSSKRHSKKTTTFRHEEPIYDLSGSLHRNTCLGSMTHQKNCPHLIENFIILLIIRHQILFEIPLIFCASLIRPALIRIDQPCRLIYSTVGISPFAIM